MNEENLIIQFQRKTGCYLGSQSFCFVARGHCPDSDYWRQVAIETSYEPEMKEIQEFWDDACKLIREDFAKQKAA